MSERAQCGYEIRLPFRGSRFCQQSARWVVEFTTPDDGVTMRTRRSVVRCATHCDSKFLPKGATGIVSSLREAPAHVYDR